MYRTIYGRQVSISLSIYIVCNVVFFYREEEILLFSLILWRLCGCNVLKNKTFEKTIKPILHALIK